MLVGLVADLFFSTRIQETARQLGVTCRIVRDPALLPVALAEHPRLLIVELALKSGDAPAVIRALRADPATRGLSIVGYLFDVQEELMAAAEQAGCDRVLSRGQLTRLLPELVAGARDPG